jgi:hypothetical protein
MNHDGEASGWQDLSNRWKHSKSGSRPASLLLLFFLAGSMGFLGRNGRNTSAAGNHYKGRLGDVGGPGPHTTSQPAIPDGCVAVYLQPESVFQKADCYLTSQAFLFSRSNEIPGKVVPHGMQRCTRFTLDTLGFAARRPGGNGITPRSGSNDSLRSVTIWYCLGLETTAQHFIRGTSPHDMLLALLALHAPSRLHKTTKCSLRDTLSCGGGRDGSICLLPDGVRGAARAACRTG